MWTHHVCWWTFHLQYFCADNFIVFVCDFTKSDHIHYDLWLPNKAIVEDQGCIHFWLHSACFLNIAVECWTERVAKQIVFVDDTHHDFCAWAMAAAGWVRFWLWIWEGCGPRCLQPVAPPFCADSSQCCGISTMNHSTHINLIHWTSECRFFLSASTAPVADHPSVTNTSDWNQGQAQKPEEMIAALTTLVVTIEHMQTNVLTRTATCSLTISEIWTPTLQKWQSCLGIEHYQHDKPLAKIVLSSWKNAMATCLRHLSVSCLCGWCGCLKVKNGAEILPTAKPLRPWLLALPFASGVLRPSIHRSLSRPPSLMIEPRFGCAEIPWWSFWVAVSSAHRRVFNPQRAWVWVQQLVLKMCSYMLKNSVLWLGWKNYWGDFVEWFTFNVFRFDCKDQVIAWSAGALPGRNLGIESRILGTHGFGRVFETGK